MTPPEQALARALPLPVPGLPAPPRVPRPERYTLANGLRVVAARQAGLPQIVIRLVLPAGSAADPTGGAGTAALVGQLLTEGTAQLTAEELNARLDLLGASVEVDVGHDFAEVELFLLSETLDEALPLLADLVVRPAFPATEVERVRDELLDSLAARLDESANVADDRTAAEVFGADHPYGRPALGTPDSVAELSVSALQAFHHAYYRPEGSLLVAAGDLNPRALAEQLERVLHDWRGAPEAPLTSRDAEAMASGAETIILPWKGALQSEIRIAGRGLPRNSADWIPAALANYILGGSTITGRLGANLREEKGWTYGARSSFVAALGAGGWVAETAVDVEVRDEALREMHREIRRILDEPVGDAELRRAKDALILSLPRAFETPRRVVSRFVTLEAFGLPDEYWSRFPAAVEAVTAEEVMLMARRYLDPARLVSVLVG